MRDPTNPFAPLDNAGWMSMDERKDAADRIAALEAKLVQALAVREHETDANIALRDAFIVREGLWQKFIDHLSSAAQEKKDDV